MINYLQGKIILIKDKFITLDVNGVGYKIFLSKKSILNLPEIGQNLNPSTKLRIDGEPSRTIKLFCFQDVKETALDLYGFYDYEELEFFEILNNIRGIGPKVGLEISSLGPLEKIKEKILNQDEKIFEGIPGIGKKRTMTIILELTGKIKNISNTKKSEADEIEDALVNLGFPKQKVKEVLPQIPKEIKNTEERVKEGLKLLTRNR